MLPAFGLLTYFARTNINCEIGFWRSPIGRNLILSPVCEPVHATE